jgi:amidase
MKCKVENLQAYMSYPEHPVPHAPQGALHGLSFAVKDLFDVAGYPTSAGQPHMLALSGIKAKTAPVVQRFLDAGAEFVGKTVTDELAFSLNGQNAHFGSPVNCAAPERICGGSSSGSAAAVAHQTCDFALGTDTGGSIRAPASHNGLFGMRTSHGRIAMTGSHPLAPSFDVIGWFARDADVFARVAEVIFSEPVQHKPIHLIMANEFWELLAPEVAAAFQPAIKLLQIALTDASVHSFERVKVLNAPFDELTLAFRQAQGWEAWQVNGEFIKRHGPLLGPGVAQRFDWSSQVSLQQYEHAQSVRTKLKRHVLQGLGHNGIWILPTMPDCAPLINQTESELEAYRAASLKLLCVAGLTGLPQINLPLGKHHGVPLGVSLIGPKDSDMWLVGIAQQVAQVAALAGASR